MDADGGIPFILRSDNRSFLAGDQESMNNAISLPDFVVFLVYMYIERETVSAVGMDTIDSVQYTPVYETKHHHNHVEFHAIKLISM